MLSIDESKTNTDDNDRVKHTPVIKIKKITKVAETPQHQSNDPL